MIPQVANRRNSTTPQNVHFRVCACLKRAKERTQLDAAIPPLPETSAAIAISPCSAVTLLGSRWSFDLGLVGVPATRRSLRAHTCNRAAFIFFGQCIELDRKLQVCC